MIHEAIALLPYEVRRVSLASVEFSAIPKHVRPYSFPDDESLANGRPVDDVTWFARYGQHRRFRFRRMQGSEYKPFFGADYPPPFRVYRPFVIAWWNEIYPAGLSRVAGIAHYEAEVISSGTCAYSWEIVEARIRALRDAAVALGGRVHT